jgi:hypothetical protein
MLTSADMALITVKSLVGQYQQTSHYNSFLPTLLEKHHSCDWALVVDFNEFVYTKQPDQNLALWFSKFSSSLPRVDQIRIKWKMFGSSGLILHPKSIRCGLAWWSGITENKKFK